MKKRIHLFGASGSGTTTLAKTLCERLAYRHFDTDDFYWEPTNPPYTAKRPINARLELMQEALRQDGWVLSGSLIGWGDPLIPLFDLAVFVYLDPKVRLERIRQREIERYGDAVLPGGERYESAQEFYRWAALYDDDHADVHRKRINHERWLKQLPCATLRVTNEGQLEHSMKQVLKVIQA